MFTPEIYESWKEKQFSKYQELLKQIGKEKLEKVLSGKVLDIGIGNGYFEQFLKENGISADIIGIDSNEEMIKGVENAVLGDGDNLPFDDETFDTIICLDTIHLLETQDFLRVLKKGGYILVSLFFNKQNFESKKEMLKDKLGSCYVIHDFVAFGEENEIFMLCRK